VPTYKRRLASSFWQRVVKDIEAIVPVYKRMNKVMSFGLDDNVRKTGISLLNECNTCLDVGVGPGDSVIKLIKSGKCGYVVGLEPSISLAAVARKACSDCDIVVGVAEYIPLRPLSVDCAIAFFSVRDFIDLDKAVENIANIVRRQVVVGDVFVIGNRIVRFLQMIWVCVIIPLIALFLTGSRWKSYVTLCKTLKGWLTASQLSRIMENKGLTPIRVKEFAFGGLAVVEAKKCVSGNNGC
jgi:demethylmenaquinone methyltransferase/2-methoxy-6-polyprenyl-1,4-benzoquinol methylase